MSRSRLVSIVVPTYNERQNLTRLVAAIQAHVRVPYEIVIVDDSSPDGTADLARDLAREHPVRLVSRPAKAGLGSAYRDGFKAARGDLVFEMDADLSHDPRFVPALIDAVESGGADVAVGSRYVPGGRVIGWSRYRRLVSGVGNMLARVVLRPGARDVTSGYRCYSRAAADLVQSVESDGYAFQVEALFVARSQGLRIVEVPITFENRVVGKSKLGAGEFGRFLQTLVRLRLARSTVRGRPSRVA
ncbi:MAG: polyprenol monophosphomannose synthase [Candidatus Thermoplasmatota archaeon]